MSANHASNLDRAVSRWGPDLPAWVRLLASACDASSQRLVGERLGLSSGTVSRLVNRSYAASYDEPERLVRAAYGGEDVLCPIWGAIPLASCLRNRRRPGPPRNTAHHLHDRHCPTCPNNSDREEN